jgi:putative DNA methylase
MDHNFKPKETPSDFGWYSRGYIPHFDGGQITQFITLRLFDSMPQDLLDKWRREAQDDVEFRKRVEAYLDAGYGECWLRREEIATIVQGCLRFHDGKKYRLTAWVVMPNHVHFLVTPLENQHLSEILHSIKSYTAHEANKALARTGQFWQPEAFDRYIRNKKHLTNTIKYIENNPVKAGLCSNPADWKYSSAHFRSGG